MSDLASHIKEYGVWFKGNGFWKNQVFYSNAFAKIKRQKIQQRLLNIYTSGSQLEKKQKIILLQKVMFQSYRLFLYINKTPQPIKYVLKKDILLRKELFYNEFFSEKILGSVGCMFFSKLFSNDSKLEIYNSIIETMN